MSLAIPLEPMEAPTTTRRPGTQPPHIRRSAMPTNLAQQLLSPTETVSEPRTILPIMGNTCMHQRPLFLLPQFQTSTLWWTCHHNHQTPSSPLPRRLHSMLRGRRARTGNHTPHSSSHITPVTHGKIGLLPSQTARTDTVQAHCLLWAPPGRATSARVPTTSARGDPCQGEIITPASGLYYCSMKDRGPEPVRRVRRFPT